MENCYFTVDKADAGTRIDLFLSGELEDVTRSRIQKLILKNRVLVNSMPASKNYKIKTGDIIIVNFPEPENLDIIPENIPIDILYEDNDVIVVNKAQGMVVHPANGHYTGTLVNALMFHCGESLSEINGVLRPGIVHRIDKDTSGIIVAAKNNNAHQKLALQLAQHSMNRIYQAIAYNNFKEDEGTVDLPIGRSVNDRKKMSVTYKNSKNAVTHYRVLERYNKFTMIELKLETGRTHQIRVHMSHIGHPLAGDIVYGPSKPIFGLKGQALHARVLGFVHPSLNKYMEFESALPDYFIQLIKKIGQQ